MTFAKTQCLGRLAVVFQIWAYPPGMTLELALNRMWVLRVTIHVLGVAESLLRTQRSGSNHSQLQLFGGGKPWFYSYQIYRMKA